MQQSRHQLTRGIAAALALLLSATTAGAQPGRVADAQSLRQAMLVAEDARDTSAAALAPLLEAITGADTALQALAARALGRFERPTLATHVIPLLASPSAMVRREAANALAQLAQGTMTMADRDGAVESLAAPLRDALSREEHVLTRGVMAWSLGRLPYASPASAAVAEPVLRQIIEQPAGQHDVLGALRGMEALARATATLGPRSAETVAALRRVADSAEARRLALSALLATHQADAALLDARARDDDAQVRRLAVMGSAADPALAGTRERIVDALGDSAAMVRLEALRAYGRLYASEECEPVMRALADSSTHVALLAIDVVGERCGGAAGAADTLARLARTLPRASTRAWHRAAHAYVALARVDSARARPLAPRFGAHPTWQVRMYAARGAEAAHDRAALDRLARDGVANVREAAIGALSRGWGHDADAAARSALAQRDYQLIVTASNALVGTPARAVAVRALARALDRITRERKETSRDPRVAILARLGEIGDTSLVPRLRPYLSDFDAVVADSAAAILGRWTGEDVRATPVPLRKRTLSIDEAERLVGARLRIIMGSGDTILVALLADEAPATVARIAWLARTGWYDGRTFHRVVPNFVIQGGSPGANEYAGDSLYLRDEVYPRTHARGTLGISTRGRDTGDAQLFVNLVDNPRLDFGYTVFGVVEEGMDAVDRVLEGDVMRRVEVIARGR